MRRASSFLAGVLALAGPGGPAPARAACDQPVYLTFDTGHMGVADQIAQVLKRHEVKVTFFLANERTRQGGTSLDDSWAAWWGERAAEGHAFGSHTWDHAVWRSDAPRGGFQFRPTQGPQAGQVQHMDDAAYCAQLQRPAERFEAMTGMPMASVFRAPGGKTSPALLAAASRCGWTHVGWSAAGFLGDELPSESVSNDQLLRRALRDVRAGDVLLAHLGIWSRRDPWAPAVLEPLIVGLKARGLCFATLREHPSYAAAARLARR